MFRVQMLTLFSYNKNVTTLHIFVHSWSQQLVQLSSQLTWLCPKVQGAKDKQNTTQNKNVVMFVNRIIALWFYASGKMWHVVNMHWCSNTLMQLYNTFITSIVLFIVTVHLYLLKSTLVFECLYLIFYCQGFNIFKKYLQWCEDLSISNNGTVL